MPVPTSNTRATRPSPVGRADPPSVGTEGHVLERTWMGKNKRVQHRRVPQLSGRARAGTHRGEHVPPWRPSDPARKCLMVERFAEVTRIDVHTRTWPSAPAAATSVPSGLRPASFRTASARQHLYGARVPGAIDPYLPLAPTDDYTCTVRTEPCQTVAPRPDAGEVCAPPAWRPATLERASSASIVRPYLVALTASRAPFSGSMASAAIERATSAALTRVLASCASAFSFELRALRLGLRTSSASRCVAPDGQCFLLVSVFWRAAPQLI